MRQLSISLARAQLRSAATDVASEMLASEMAMTGPSADRIAKISSRADEIMRDAAATYTREFRAGREPLHDHHMLIGLLVEFGDVTAAIDAAMEKPSMKLEDDGIARLAEKHASMLIDDYANEPQVRAAIDRAPVLIPLAAAVVDAAIAWARWTRDVRSDNAAGQLAAAVRAYELERGR